MRRIRFASNVLIVLLVLGLLPATGTLAQDLEGTSVPPMTEWPGPFNSPSWQQTVDNGDGTFTFSQAVSDQSTPPHYAGPWYYSGDYGFSYYSWYNQDYGWAHDFPDYNQPDLHILSATLTVRAWDVDSEVWRGWDGEYDGITGDGTWLNPQYLQGTNSAWSVTVMNVDPNAFLDGWLNVAINIDMHHSSRWWATTLDYSRLDLTYSYSANGSPYQPVLEVYPVGCTYTLDDLVVTVTGPTPADPDGDSVTFEYRWLVDTGTGFYVDDEFAGRGDHTTDTVPYQHTVIGDKWKVEVTAVDQYGSRSTANSVSFATIGQCDTPPIADAGSDMTFCTSEVTLDGTASYDPDGTIVTYAWYTYQGASWVAIGSTPTLTHDFGAVGTYQVRLTVTDNHGATDSANAYVTVEVCNEPPVADPAGPYVGTEGSLVVFNGEGSSDPDGDPLTYTWDFGDSTSASGASPSHTYADNGSYSVCLTVSDGEFSHEACATALITNVAPVVTVSGTTGLNEGDSATYGATVTDPGILDTHTIVWDCDGDGFDDGTGTAVTCTFVDGPASVLVRAQATDNDGDLGVGQHDVDVSNVSPSVGPITVDLMLAEVGTPINASAEFDDPGAIDTHTVVCDWDDGSPDPGHSTTSPVVDNHVYTSPGVYTITMTVTDKDGGQGQSVFEYVVIYDPGAGFVTGGGWIDSPEGAYSPDPLLIGKANFGFVSKYKRGASVPTGQTEFQFQAAGMNFHSTNYQWLVVNQNGTRAQFKGHGTINGEGEYSFMMWGRDDSPDTFRVRIWEEDEDTGAETDIYDNGFEGSGNEDGQLLGGGNIVIH